MSSIYTLMLSSVEFQILVFWLQNITRVKVPNQNNWKTQGGAERRQAGSLATDRRQGHLQLTEGRVTCNRQKAGSLATDRRQGHLQQTEGRVTSNRQKAGKGHEQQTEGRPGHVQQTEGRQGQVQQTEGRQGHLQQTEGRQGHLQQTEGRQGHVQQRGTQTENSTASVDCQMQTEPIRSV